VPTLKRMKTATRIKNVPLFPIVPFVPAALLIASLALAIRAFQRVRRLERRLANGKL